MVGRSLSGMPGRRRKIFEDSPNVVTDPDVMAARMIGFPDARVLTVEEDGDGVHVSVETKADEARCSSCGAPAVMDEHRRVVVRRPGLMFGRPLELRWQLRGWRCSSCDAEWTEEEPRRPQ